MATSADIAIIGGSAGGGKSFVLELEATRHIENPFFGAVGFRRTTTQIKAEGGLWDTSKKIYPLCGGAPKESTLQWSFPSGAKIKFAHLEHEKDVHNYQGSQIPLIIFDELTHFTEYMFWYMVSRNRSDCGVRPYIRASCNPDPQSWVAKMIEWYIDQETGYPIPERVGVIRYFTRDGDNIVWGDSAQQVIDMCPHIFSNPALLESGVKLTDMVKTFTFIPGSIYENKLFIANDPGYLGALLALPAEEKARLLDGNWKISLDGLMLCDYTRIESIFDNYPEQSAMPRRCITVDAARFGRDFCVIYVWRGWEVIFCVVIKQSDALEITAIIEGLRKRFSIVRDDVVVDQDGVGDGTVKTGNYTGFHGGAAAVKDPDSRIVENYFNYKTQCAYRFCRKRVNTGQVRFSINDQTCMVYDTGQATGIYTTKIMCNGKVRDIRDLIKEDLRSMKRSELKDDGVQKIRMNTKEEQKIILKRSPDFGDTALMREHIELKSERKKFQQSN